jgi:hypothetical protein
MTWIADENLGKGGGHWSSYSSSLSPGSTPVRLGQEEKSIIPSTPDAARTPTRTAKTPHGVEGIAEEDPNIPWRKGAPLPQGGQRRRRERREREPIISSARTLRMGRWRFRTSAARRPHWLRSAIHTREKSLEVVWPDEPARH